MSQSDRSWHRQLRRVNLVVLGSAAILALNEYVIAQVVPDNTLGAESSVIDPPTENITGGAQRGDNLFHSFLEFNIGEGSAIYFTNPDGVRNIFSRVTGNNASNILGKLGVLGNANLFFMNPNGMIFGANASLDIKGSFLATTANSLIFDNGFKFSANSSEAPPLLTINVPVGLQFGENPGSILNQSRKTDSRSQPIGLQVDSGRTLALVGGEVTLEGGILNAPDGQIELGSVGSYGSVSLIPTATSYVLDYQGINDFQNINLTQGAKVNTSGNSGGSIRVQGERVTLNEGSTILADTRGNLNGGGIQIEAEQFRLEDEAYVSTSTIGSGQAGNLTIHATESVELTGTGFENSQQTFIAKGLDGTLNLFDRRSGLFAGTDGTGAAGNINIDTKSLSLQNGAVVFSPSFNGLGGKISINASRIVELSGSALASLSTSYGTTRTGGDITIKTDKLTLQDGALVLSTSTSNQDGANIQVNASEIELLRTPLQAIIPTGIITNTIRRGKAGNIQINTGKLVVQDGALVSSGSGGGGLISAERIQISGQGGELIVNATESVELIGESSDGRFPSGLYSQTRDTGEAGNLLINTNQLIIRDGAVVSTSTFGSRDGGNLSVQASSIQLIGFGSRVPSGLYTITAGLGKAGELSIEANQLVIRDGARIDTGTFNLGDGGSLIINVSESVQLIGNSTADQFLVSDRTQSSTSSLNLEEVGDFISELARLTRSFNNGLYPSGLFAQANQTAKGKAGNLTVTTPTLLILDGAQVTVSSIGEGEAGNLSINANSVQLDRGQITAQTLSGNGGNITLSVENLLLMRNGSQISTTAGTARAGGDGGNINIDANFIIAVPNENSDITANAFEGRGGKININTQGIYGLQYRQSQTDLSDITVSSELGVAGIVNINSPEVDPNRGLVNLLVLPETTEVVQACTPSGNNPSEFTITGRGGLPPTPQETLNNEPMGVDWVTLHSHSSTVLKQPDLAPVSEQIVEAQGWIVDADGKVILVAQADSSTHSWQKAVNCHEN